MTPLAVNIGEFGQYVRIVVRHLSDGIAVYSERLNIEGNRGIEVPSPPACARYAGNLLANTRVLATEGLVVDQ